MKDSLEALGRLRVQAIALLAVVFVMGALTGAAIERARHWRGAPPDRHGPPPGGPRERGGLPPDFSRELRLSAEQETRIRAILDRSRPRTDSLLSTMLPQLKALTDSVRAEIRAELTPEQTKVFDEQPPRLFGNPGRPLGPPPGSGERPGAGPDPSDPPPGERPAPGR